MVGRRRRRGGFGRRLSTLFVLIALLPLLLPACRDEVTTAAPSPPSRAEPTRTTEPPASTASTEQGPTIVFLGDSLTAGFGLAESQAFPALIAEALEDEIPSVRVVNAGVSGDTTAGGRARLDWLLKQSPDVLVVGLGGNDGLRGLDLEASEANLRAIVERGREAGAEVVLLGLRLPPNYGADYTSRFEAIYETIAGEMDVVFVPFFLEGVGGEPSLNLPDGIHPNADGHAVISRTILPAVREALDRAAA